MSLSSRDLFRASPCPDCENPSVCLNRASGTDVYQCLAEIISLCDEDEQILAEYWERDDPSYNIGPPSEEQRLLNELTDLRQHLDEEAP